MQFKSLLLAAVAATGAVATALPNPFSPIPGYPIGNLVCLTDDQATFLVNQFKSILTNTDRKAANTTAQTLIADSYVETSSSINILAGYPIDGPSFSGKSAFIAGAVGAPAITMSVLDIVHDCNKVVWQWRVTNLGANVYPVKGFNKMTVGDVKTGQLIANDLEFNSVAWGTDIGFTCKAPGQ